MCIARDEGASTSQEQKREQHLPIRHARRPAYLFMAMFHVYRVTWREIHYEVRLHDVDDGGQEGCTCATTICNLLAPFQWPISMNKPRFYCLLGNACGILSNHESVTNIHWLSQKDHHKNDSSVRTETFLSCFVPEWPSYGSNCMWAMRFSLTLATCSCGTAVAYRYTNSRL